MIIPEQSLPEGTTFFTSKVKGKKEDRYTSLRLAVQNAKESNPRFPNVN